MERLLFIKQYLTKPRTVGALQEDCGVADLKMSDYGILPSELDTLARNARETMGALFAANPCEMSHEECVKIFEKSYR